MIKKHSHHESAYLSMFLDALIAIVAFSLALTVRANFKYIYFLDLFPNIRFVTNVNQSYTVNVWLLIFSVITFHIIYRWFTVYDHSQEKPLDSILWTYAQAQIVSFAIIFITLYMVKVFHISRLFIILFAIFNFALIVLKEYLTKKVLERRRQKGVGDRHVLIVGWGGEAIEYIESLRSLRGLNYKIIGTLYSKPEKPLNFIGNRVLGDVTHLKNVLETEVVDEVAVVRTGHRFADVEQVVQTCETYGVRVRVLDKLFNTTIAKPYLSSLNGLPMLTYEMTSEESFQHFVKRVIDLAGSAIGLITLAPLMLAISTAIKLQDGGPVFFRQTRSGLNGRLFSLFKFRSMEVDAESQLEDLSHLNEVDGPVFKIKNDPRITRLGKFLRKTSLDELPQLINVLKGEMSLVGPRPPIPDEVVNYENWQRRRLSMRPGITCIWQVNGRNDLDFEKWMQLDLEYIDNWSLLLDFEILIKTIPAVLKAEGH